MAIEARIRARMIAIAAFAALPAPAIAAPVLAQPLDKITISVIAAAAQGPLFIAEDRGYFKDEGLDANVLAFDSLTSTTVAVVSGVADVGSTSLNVAVYNLAGTGAITIIAGLSQEKAGYHNGGFIATNAAWDAGLKSFKDFKGKRIGISTTGSGAQYEVGLVAQKYGIPMSEITLVPLQSLSNQLAAFKGNQVDALSIASPYPDQLAANGGGHILGWSGDETPYIAGGIYANANALRNRRPVLEKYLRAVAHGAKDYNAALNALDANGQVVKGPGFDDIVGIIAKYTKAPVSQLLAAGFPYVDPTLNVNVSDIANQIAFWRSSGAVTAPIDAGKIIDLSYLPK